MIWVANGRKGRLIEKTKSGFIVTLLICRVHREKCWTDGGTGRNCGKYQQPQAYADDAALWRKWKLKSLLIVKVDSKKYSAKNKIMALTTAAHRFMANKMETMETVTGDLRGASNHCRCDFCNHVLASFGKTIANTRLCDQAGDYLPTKDSSESKNLGFL